MSKRKRYRSSEWPGLLEQWSRSGESAERFSTRLGISVTTLTRWRKETQHRSPTASPGSVAPKSVETSRSLFAPVQVVRSARADGGLVEVVTRGGCVVRVHGAVDEETLASVFAAVGVC
jgi:transposase-like protein